MFPIGVLMQVLYYDSTLKVLWRLLQNDNGRPSGLALQTRLCSVACLLYSENTLFRSCLLIMHRETLHVTLRATSINIVSLASFLVLPAAIWRRQNNALLFCKHLYFYWTSHLTWLGPLDTVFYCPLLNEQYITSAKTQDRNRHAFYVHKMLAYPLRLQLCLCSLCRIWNGP